MNCNEIRELISCMLDNELSAEDSAIVTEHLAECPECMRVFEAFHAISLSMEDLEDVPAGFTDDVMNRINASAEQSKTKKHRISFLRIAGVAGLAACVALVMMAGTRFASTHMYIGGGNGDTAEYVRIHQNTPTPAIGGDSVNYAAAPGTENTDGDDGTSAAMPNDISDPISADETTDPSASPLPDLLAPVSVSPEPVNDPEDTSAEPTPSVSPAPIPAVTPTPVPPMQLLLLSDLLIVQEEADFDRFTDSPAYEVTVTDESGTDTSLKLWTDGTRIYCKNEGVKSAWYTIGTPAQLTKLLGAPAKTPIPETPVPETPVPETPAPKTTNPVAVSPTPFVAAVTPTPTAVVSPAP